MPYCPECGKSVSETAKFCRNCGASQAEETAGETPAVKSPPENPVCKACKTILLPGDKFCSTCGEKIAPPAPVPASVQDDEPAPGPEPVCASCGAVLGSDARFCGSCGIPAGSRPPVQEPVPEVTERSDEYVCSACGSRLKGTEKFCGICGKAAAAVRPESPAPPAANVCGSCGETLGENAKFCGICGAAAGTSVPAAPAPVPPAVSVPATPPGGESVLGVIPNAKKMKMFGASYDTYTIVVTPRRMILAQMTQAMLNAALTEANLKAKAEGKGFFGIMGSQMAASFGFGKRYEKMPPEQALQETPKNFAIENQRITAIKLKLIDTENAGMDGREFKMLIESMDGKFEYMIAEDDRFATLLQTAYGERVKMPSGLFKAGPVRVKFF